MGEYLPLEPLPVVAAIGLGDQALHPVVHRQSRSAA